MALEFDKYQGLGNDFVLIDARESRRWISAQEAKMLCDRHRGIGADGVLTLLPAENAGCDVRMHLYNADGSTAEMCGNGLRCLVLHVLASSSPRQTPLRVETEAGLREGWIEAGGAVRTTLGVATEPMEAVLVGEAGPGVGLVISLGNPHFVLSPYPAGTDLLVEAARLGPGFERSSPAFPRGTNVEFIAARASAEIDVVVYERGCGITQACGTGAAAAVVAARRFGVLARDPGPVKVRLPGGSLAIDVREQIFQIGAAERVFDGTTTLI